jgi:hypothetical protein
MLSVVMLNVVILSVVAPFLPVKYFQPSPIFKSKNRNLHKVEPGKALEIR